MTNDRQDLGAGHDAPVTTRAQDDYDRWPIATAISNVIASSPPEWSTRIGLYGKWGDGKTSVLYFLTTQQQAIGNIVIRYSPWGVSNEAQVWTDFGKQLRQGLAANDIKLGRLWRPWFWIKERISQIVSVLKGAASVAEQALSLPVPKGAVDATAGLLERHLSIRKKDVARISQMLGSRRVIVFIDDLDRTDPAITPKLLLALRELLDFSKFVFVLAFDRSVVSRSLCQHNPAWGDSGEIFIEKVIDFPFELPAPSSKQVRALAGRQFKALCPFVPISTVDDIVAVLPSNPRRLKLFARMIASLSHEVERHESDELDWPTILIFGLLRIESEEFTNELVNRICDENDPSFMDWTFSRNPTEEQEQKLGELLGLFPLLPETTRQRLRTLVKAWQQKRSLSQGERLRYQVYFALHPHNITWGEFKGFFQEWRSDKASDKILTFVNDRTKSMNVPVDNVAEELLESVTGYYGTLMERAGNVTDHGEHAALIGEASDCLDLYQELFLGTDGIPATAIQTVSAWQRMVSVCANWQHFTANTGEPALRSKEVECLVLCANALENGSDAYESLKPWDHHSPIYNERADGPRRDFFQKLRDAVEPRAIDGAIGLFQLKGGIKSLFSDKEHLGFTYLLSAPESAVFQGANRLRLLQAISAGEHNAVIRQNVLEYLDLLLRALEHAGRFCNADKRKKFIADSPELIEKIWKIVVYQRSQYRFLDGLRKDRAKLVEAGAKGDKLIQPDWLRQTHADPAEIGR